MSEQGLDSSDIRIIKEALTRIADNTEILVSGQISFYSKVRNSLSVIALAIFISALLIATFASGDKPLF